MKKRFCAVCLFICLLCSFLLQGCHYQVQLSQRLLIQGVGIDYENDSYKATMQVSQVGEKDDDTVAVLQGEGKSAMDAMNAVTLSTGKKPLYSHSLLLVLGKSCAQRGLSDTVDFFIRYPEAHPTVNVLMADGTAESVLNTKKEDGKYVQAREIAEVAKAGKYNGKTVNAEMLDVINQLRGEGSSPYLPVVQKQEKEIMAAGTAVFQGDKLKTQLDEKETRGFLLLTGKLEGGTEVLNVPEIGKVTFELEKADAKIEPVTDGDPLRFDISIQCGASIAAADMVSGKKLDFQMYQNLEKLLGQRLKQECEEAIITGIKKNSSDIFNFGRHVYQSDPEYWRTHGENWKQEMANAKFTVTVEAKLRRGGQEITGLESGDR